MLEIDLGGFRDDRPASTQRGWIVAAAGAVDIVVSAAHRRPLFSTNIRRSRGADARVRSLPE
jgi:hypothetical protein